MIGFGLRRRVLALTAAVVAGVLVLSACSSGSSGPSQLTDRQESTFMGFAMNPPQPRPQFTLTDDSGRTFDFTKETAGHPTFLYFGYTNCPDVCPTTMADIHQALKAESPELQKETKVIFVTTDVKRDTGPVLKGYLSNLSEGLPDFIGLTGTQIQINAAQGASKITLAQEDGQEHSAKVLLFGPDDYARVAFVQSDNESQAMAHDLKLIAK